MVKQKYLECGKAVSTHGVRGTLRLESYCDSPDKLARLRRLYVKMPDGSYECMKVRAASVQKNMVLCTFEALTTLEAAIPFKGTVFYADRADFKLDDNVNFIADMIGLGVYDAVTGEKYGTLSEVISPAGRDIFVVDDVRGGNFMIPSVPEFIIRIDTDSENKGIYVKLIEGLRDEN